MLQIGVYSEPPIVEVKNKKIISEIKCSINETPENITRNIKSSINRDLPQVIPHETQPDKVVCLVAGGPSLSTTFGIIEEKKNNGVPIVALNGTYKYCFDRGVSPSAMIMLDSREFNKRFVEPTLDKCKYFIASQCHPSVFDKLSNNETYIWHCAGDTDNEHLLKEKYNDQYYPVMGGSTVTFRAIHLLRMLGFCKFELFGFDSCIMDEHHAYSQPENDEEQEIEVVLGDRKFRCTVAHFQQAKEFVQLVSTTGDHYELSVHGDGLISYIIKHPEILKEAA
tara:strand:+ start:795 stop:1637 length:843 start_codon:yes stop_codon:yes gene_type:complete